jgi:hypothetical protein
MKFVKITLVLAFVGLIFWFVTKSLLSVGVIDPPLHKPGSEYLSYREDIEKEISTLKAIPDTVFYEDIYRNIKYKIDEFYTPHPPQYPYGRFGKTQADNDLFHNIFSKNLFAIYIDKFIKNSFIVFSKPVWDTNDIVFIREEIQELMNSPMLSEGTIRDSLISLQQILGKYYEINNFLSQARISLPEIEVRNSLKYTFPFNDLKNKIDRIDSYKSNRLGNSYVNNNIELHSKLSRKKKSLIRDYRRYIQTKLNSWKGTYVNYPNFNIYRDMAHKKLEKEIKDFKRNCEQNEYNYNIEEYTTLLTLLEEELNLAYENLN